mmetsp:Transcript_100046/g.158342  ORF Transcript_100046/g.158342 Transcript_100046/m.158342 type:complete len:127 (+) Transcript_100046:82-462(+)
MTSEDKAAEPTPEKKEGDILVKLVNLAGNDLGIFAVSPKMLIKEFMDRVQEKEQPKGDDPAILKLQYGDIQLEAGKTLEEQGVTDGGTVSAVWRVITWEEQVAVMKKVNEIEGQNCIAIPTEKPRS